MVSYVLQVGKKEAWIERMADCSESHDAIPAANDVNFEHMTSFHGMV